MKTSALIYVPSDTPDAMALATKKVAGVPLIVRGVMTLAQAGVGRIALLIAGTQREKIVSALTKFDDRNLPQLDIIEYEEPYGVGQEAAGRLAEIAGSRVLLINANLIFEAELVSTIRSTEVADGRILLCEEGAHRLPVMDATPGALRTLSDFTRARPRSIESCLAHLRTLAVETRAKLPTRCNTFLLRTIRDRAVAEKSLAEAIRHRTPGPVAKILNKRISLPISLFLSKLWISPNAITAVNIVIGLFAGVFVADGHRYEMILLGAVLFQIASIVDGCDGEVAKLTFRCTKFGQYADSLSDNLSLGSMLAGIMAGYWRSTHSPVAFYVGTVMLANTAITIFWIVYYLKKNTQSASLATFDKAYLQKLTNQPRWLMAFIKYGKYTLWKDMYSFAFLVFALFGVLYWWLFITAFGTTLAAITLTYLNAQSWLAARSRRRAGASGAEAEGQRA